MKNLYEMKEAAKIVSLYSDHIKHLILDHEDMTGFFGGMCFNLCDSTCNYTQSNANH